jgi:hypothetical protein
MNHCAATKPNGTPCQAKPAAGSKYCFFHDPDKAEKRTAAQRAGGAANKAKTLGEGAEDVPLASAEDIVALLALTINQLRRGEIDVKITNGIGYLTGMLLKAIEAGEMSGRLERLEAAVLPFQASQGTFNPHPFREMEA